jgi:hypothetical protein
MMKSRILPRMFGAIVLLSLVFTSSVSLAQEEQPQAEPAAAALAPAEPAEDAVPTYNDKYWRSPAGDPSVRLPVYRETEASIGLQSAEEQEEMAASQFGYTLQTTAFLTLGDGTRTRVSFPNDQVCTPLPCKYVMVDDEFSDPLSIGFPFPFFENNYTHFSVSTNGMLTFGTPSSSYINVDIPHTTIPNNFIAPFWEDLDVNPDYGGRVNVFRPSPAQDYVVIEWVKVNRHNVDSPPLLTFQVFLYTNGNIRFQYLDVSGVVNQFTAGIEDIDGRDGLRYLHMQSGLTSNSAVLIVRPPAARRVKTLPATSGSFTVNSAAEFAMKVVNTGSLGADTYNLLAASSTPGWTTSFYRAEPFTLLTDTNGDGKIDTGPLAQGAALDLKVRISAPLAALAGSWSDITATAQSVNNAAVIQGSKFQAAVPIAFAQAYTDEEAGFRLGLFSKTSALYPRIEAERWFSGSTLAVAPTPGQDFLYAWEMSGSIDEPYFYWTDLEFIRVDRAGNPKGSYRKLTSNQTASEYTEDRFPSIGVTSDNYTGVVFIRDVLNKNFRQKSNVFLAILHPNATTPAALINITNNSLYRGESDQPVPIFATPKITATTDGRFIVAWARRTPTTTDEDTSNIWYAVYSKTGTLLKAPTPMTSSTQVGEYYLSPTLVTLADNRAILGYHLHNPALESYSLLYSTSSSNTFNSPQRIDNVGGWGMDGMQLSGGAVLFSWTHFSGDKISYLLLNQSGGGFAPQAAPKTVQAPDRREVDYLSVTAEASGSGIITWMDSRWNHNLYYMLLGGDGTEKTPPLAFHSTSRTDITIITSSTGQGIAYYEGAHVSYLPYIGRNKAP